MHRFIVSLSPSTSVIVCVSLHESVMKKLSLTADGRRQVPDDVFGITTVTIPTKPIQLCSPVKSDQSQLRPPSSHGIGRGKRPPEKDFVDFVFEGFRLMERGVANELKAFIDFANRSYAKDEFSRIDFKEVQRIAGTCVTGCAIADPGSVEEATPYKGFTPRLVRCAHEAYKAEGERRKA